MKKFRESFLKYKRIIFVALFTVSLGIYVCGFAFKNVLNFNIYADNLGELKVYTIFHVETFEGGGKSRLTFLKNTAKQVEDKNAGTLFLIKTIKPENLKDQLELEQPDIISFGYGLGKIVLPFLTAFDETFLVRDELIESGTFNNKIYALPFIISGYAEILKNDDNHENFFCGNNEYLSVNNLKISKNVTNFEKNSFEAYKKFINSKNSSLLGTTRDVFRVENLNSLGRLSATINPIDEYTDLIQYVGVCKPSLIANEFVKALLSAQNQMTLTDYSLFSTLNNKIYTKDIYADMEEAIFRCKIPNLYA